MFSHLLHAQRSAEDEHAEDRRGEDLELRRHLQRGASYGCSNS
jgi:hypothetical protein